MKERGDPAFAAVIERLRIQLSELVDFGQFDPTTTAAKVRLLTAAAVYFNLLAVTDFGGRPGPVRHEGLVEQVVAAAFQTFQGVDPHPSPFDKAAMLLRGIVQGHPFTDANKRTGFLLAIYYLDRVGFVPRSDLPTSEVVSVCRRVSAGDIRNVSTLPQRSNSGPSRASSKLTWVPLILRIPLATLNDFLAALYNAAMTDLPGCPHLRIGELARELGLNPKTIRYYEAIGLLPAPRRNESGYRLYGAQDRERLRFIAKAKSVGLTLAEIAEILALREAGIEPCQRVRELIDGKLAAVDEQLQLLLNLRRDLLTLQKEAASVTCSCTPICQIIELHVPSPRS